MKENSKKTRELTDKEILTILYEKRQKEKKREQWAGENAQTPDKN